MLFQVYRDEKVIHETNDLDSAFIVRDNCGGSIQAVINSNIKYEKAKHKNIKPLFLKDDPRIAFSI